MNFIFIHFDTFKFVFFTVYLDLIVYLINKNINLTSIIDKEYKNKIIIYRMLYKLLFLVPKNTHICQQKKNY